MSNEDKVRRFAKPARYSATARAEHARRVLVEQEQLRRQEERDILNQDGAPSFKAITTDDLLVSNSSPPPYVATTRTGSDEEQQGSSPVASPTRHIRGAQKAKDGWMTPLGQEKEASDEREKPKETGHQPNKIEVTNVGQITMSANEKTTQKPAEQNVDENTTQEHTEQNANESATQSPSDQEEHNPTSVPDTFINHTCKDTWAEDPNVDRAEELAVEQFVSPSASPTKKEAKDNMYHRMKSIVETLLSHPANVFYRHPIETGIDGEAFLSFLHRTNKPVVDFHKILERLERRQYGEKDPFEAVSSDLEQFWTNAKQFYGPGSDQGQCALLLDRFSKIIMIEWRRDNSRAKQGKEDRRHAAQNINRLPNNHRDIAPLLAFGTRKKENDSKVTASPRLLRTEKEETKTSSASGKTLKPQIQPSQTTSAGDVFSTHPRAFLATLFSKSNGKPTSASTDMMAKLQQQFGPGAATRSNKRAHPFGSSTPMASKRKNVQHKSSAPQQVPQVTMTNSVVTPSMEKAEEKTEASERDELKSSGEDGSTPFKQEAIPPQEATPVDTSQTSVPPNVNSPPGKTQKAPLRRVSKQKNKPEVLRRTTRARRAPSVVAK